MSDTDPTQFRELLATQSFRPGWSAEPRAVGPLMGENFRPAVWRYEEARANLNRATAFVSMEDAERRNLVMVNPIEGNRYATLQNLVAAYQMVAPGESARSHRHTTNALRIVLDTAEHSYTIVNGKRIGMAPGDILLTPGWMWHGHANEGKHPAYWIDALDVPLVQHTGTRFFEKHPMAYEPVTETIMVSPFRISSREALRQGDRKPLGGGIEVSVAEDVMPTIALTVIEIPAGAATSSSKTTASAMYTIVEGNCRGEIEGLGEVRFERGDLLAIPAWTRHVLYAEHGAILVKVSDSPALKKLGLYRREE